MATDPHRPEPETGIRAEEPSALSSEPVDLSDIRWSDGLVLFVFWLLSFVVFLQFFTRYVLNNSLGWTEEVARFLLIGVTFIGSVMAARKESHIAVELFYRYLSRRGRYGAQLVVDVISLVFFATMGWFCAELASKTQQMMVSIDVQKSWIYWGVTACFGFMAIYALLALVRHVRTGTSRLIDPERFALTGTGL